MSYAVNERNQYFRTESLTPSSFGAQGFRHDADGNLVELFIAADMNCDGVADFGDIDPFILALSDAAGYASAFPNCNLLNGDFNGNGAVDFGDINPFVGLLSEEGGGGLQTMYTWDGENRLIGVAPPAGTEQDGNVKVEFAYDYLGRRVQKQVFIRTGGQWVLTVHRKFVWSGWLLLMELDGLGGTGVSPVRKYTWGLDLAGLSGNPGCNHRTSAFLERAGGIGGLLAVQDTNGTPSNPADDLNYIYFHDAAGNIGQVVNWSYTGAPAGSIVAKYEYDAYGNITAKSGSYADTNPFRWSTKYFDIETGPSDYGHRYYQAGMGRWLNRDPIGEFGGANLYGYVSNDPVNRFDPLGLAAGGGGCPKGGGQPPRDCSHYLCPQGGQASYCPSSGRCACPGAPCPGGTTAPPSPPPPDCSECDGLDGQSRDFCLSICSHRPRPPLPPPSGRPAEGPEPPEVPPPVCFIMPETATATEASELCSMCFEWGLKGASLVLTIVVTCVQIQGDNPPPPRPPPPPPRREPPTCQCMCMADDPTRPGKSHGPYPVGRMPRWKCESYAGDHPDEGYSTCYCRD
jgi:RHS repeat-associated protein